MMNKRYETNTLTPTYPLFALRGNRSLRLFGFLCVLWFTQMASLFWAPSTYASSKPKTFAAFFINTQQDAKAKQFVATLNWRFRQAIEPHLLQQNTQLFVPEYFFASSRVSARRVWFHKAQKIAEQAEEAFAKKSPNAHALLLRTRTFYQYAHSYYLKPSRYQKILFQLAFATQAKHPQKAKRFLEEGILVAPQRQEFEDFTPTQQRKLSVTRCKLGQKKPATLFINTSPFSGEIYINNRIVGVGEAQQTLRPGFYFVKVRHDGYYTWARKINLRSGQTLRLRANLPDSSQLDWYENLCKTLRPIQGQEQRTDELKKILSTLSRDIPVHQLFIGCTKVKSSSEVIIEWFYFSPHTRKMASFDLWSFPLHKKTMRFIVKKTLQQIGASPASMAWPPLKQYPLLQTSGACKANRVIVHKRKSRKKHTGPCVPYLWLELQDGLQLVGKIAAETPDSFFLEVVDKDEQPEELRNVRIYRSQVRTFRRKCLSSAEDLIKGERVTIHTRFGLTVQGTVIRATANQVTLRLATSKRERLKLPRRWILRVIYHAR